MSNAGRYEQGDCLICEKYFSLLHWHHTIPQSMGGKDSLQIPLCAQCHNVLHAHALAMYAKQKSGRAIRRKYWASPEMEINAAPYLKILVDAILSDEAVHGKQYVMQFKASPALHTALQMFKMDSNAKSLEKAILLALGETLKTRGYLDNEHSKRNQREGKDSSAGSLAKLW